ncbi:DUF4142 domain-containing protein [Myroides odoratimimus]|uniref:DUF4142 domain-containing protein n=1 Tax=Myroides odoratimimus TaxID=76832 RepID=UPI001E2EF871|nr:DUF4142 domain-containing protein [Myroides odoratimimus]
MKTYIKMIFLALIIALAAIACKERPTAKDPEKMAKDQNKANLDHTNYSQDNYHREDSKQGMNQNNHNDKKYADIIVDVISDQLYEIELAKTGKTRANSLRVREFATELEKHHTKRLQQLNALAGQFNYAIPRNLSDSQWKDIQDIESTNSKKFDKKWIDEVISAHNKAVDILIKGIDKTDHINIKNELNNTLQEVRSHLESANYIKNNIINK